MTRAMIPANYFAPLIALCISLASCSHSLDNPKATVLSVKGKVDAVAGVARTPITLSSQLARGSVVETSPESSVSLSLLPGIRIEIRQNSKMRIDRLHVLLRMGNNSPLVRTRDAAVTLLEGSVVAAVTRLPGQTIPPLTVRMAGVAVECPPSGVTFLQEQENLSRVLAVEDNLLVVSGRGAPPIQLAAGNFLSWIHSEAKFKVAEIKSDGSAQEQSEFSREAAERVQRLELARRDEIP